MLTEALSSREKVAIVALGLLVLISIVVSLRRRRALVRRLSTVSTRLERGAGGTVDGRGGVERALARLEHAADEGSIQVSEAADSFYRLVALLEGLRDGVIVWDERGRELYRNTRAVAIGGSAGDETSAEKLTRRLLDEAMAGASVTEPLEAAGPPARSFVVSAFPLDDGCRVTGAAAVIVDETDRRETERVRRAFVDGVAREIAVPVGGIAALAASIEEETDAAAARRLATRVHLAADQLRERVGRLLDFAAIEASVGPSRTALPVVAIVAAALRSLGARASRVAVVTPDATLVVLGDESQLVAALVHLLDNALTHGGSEVVVELAVRASGESVEIEVRDDGPGIPPNEVDRIFDRFARVPDRQRGGAGGAGLGLAVVRHVATIHGGDVSVSTPPGAGATFLLRLPRRGAAEPAHRRAG